MARNWELRLLHNPQVCHSYSPAEYLNYYSPTSQEPFHALVLFVKFLKYFQMKDVLKGKIVPLSAAVSMYVKYKCM